MCISKSICAVLKTQINKNITSKQSSHLLVVLVDAPDARNAVIEHQKSKCFLGEDHQTLIISSQITYVLGVMEQEVTLGRAKLSKRD
jgi:hypothetical protein